MKNAIVALVLLVASFGFGNLSAQECGGLTLSTRVSPYKDIPAVHGINIDTGAEFRIAALTQMAGRYRVEHGPSSLPIGSSFMVKYEDLSRECAFVALTTSTSAVYPLPETQIYGGDTRPEPTAITLHTLDDSYGPNGYFGPCYDYFSNGQWTGTYCG